MPKKPAPSSPGLAPNPAAALARKRWARTTPAERSQVARELNRARWGKKKKTS